MSILENPGRSGSTVIVVAGLIGLIVLVAVILVFLTNQSDTDKAEVERTHDQLYDRTVAASSQADLLEVIEKSFDLECNDYIEYREQTIQYYSGNSVAAEKLDDDATVTLASAIGRINEMIHRIETKALACGYDDPAITQLTEIENNNLRRADVFTILSTIDRYYSSENSWPGSLSEITPLLEDELRYYRESNINPAGSVNESTPAEAGIFPIYTALAEPSAPGMIHHPMEPQSTEMIVFMRGAECGPDSHPIEGDPAKMVVLYRLESHDNISCIDI